MFLKYSLLKLQPTHKPENSSKNLLGEKSGDSGAKMVRSESPLLPQEDIGGKKKKKPAHINKQKWLTKQNFLGSHVRPDC